MAHYHATCDTAPVGLNVDSGQCGQRGTNTPAVNVDSGEQRLQALGYKQALRRKFTLVSNTAISLSIISTLLGITGSMPIAYSNGGSPTAVWGFVLVACMTMAVGLSMAEIVSALPSSGGPYFWAVHLAPKTGRLPAFAGWVTGWFNLLGQVSITAGIGYTFSNHTAAMWAMSNGLVLNQAHLLAIYGVVLVAHGLMNTISTRLLAWLSTFSAAWHILGSITLVILLPTVAPRHQSAAFVFTEFQGVGRTETGLGNNAMIFFVGMLMAQFAFTGYDASGHLSEETRAADKNAAWGIVLAIGLSAIVGLMYVIALMFCIQDPARLFTGQANAYVVGQIYYDVFQARYGSATGAIVVMGIPLVAAFLCGSLSVASSSRMLWAFSRDGGVPYHRVWSSVNPLTGTPINAVWAMTMFSFILGLPMLHSTVAFSAVVSISTIGLYISYGIPILIWLVNSRSCAKGPFSLGPLMSPIVATIACLWICFITVIFVLPTELPVTRRTFNWAPVAVGAVLVGTLVSWSLPCGVGARHWFRGGKQTLLLDVWGRSAESSTHDDISLSIPKPV